MTAKINEFFRIFCWLQIQKKTYGYVFLRVIGRKGNKFKIDIPVYLTSRQRLTLKRSQFKDGQVDKGLPPTDIAKLNTYLDHLETKANNYTTFNKSFTKEQVENHIYTSDNVYQFSDDFVRGSKRKRERSIEISVPNLVQTDLYKKLRKEFGKKIKKIIVVDEDGFEQEQEIIIDPLSMEDFPNNFSDQLYERFKNEVYTESGTLHKNFSLLDYIKGRLFKNEPSERITIDKDIIENLENDHFQTMEKQIGKKLVRRKLLDIELSHKYKHSLISDQKAKEILLLSTEQYYKGNHWNKNNIFEMFGTIYYDSTIPDTYRKILIRLFEYREHKHPKEDIKYLNAQWLIDFFLFLKENGWYTINTSTFDPLKYDKKIFHQEKERQSYKPKSLNKMMGITKTLINSTNNKFSFFKKGYLPKLDLSDFRLKAITDEKDEDGTRIEHNINKDELDQLFWFQFDKKKIDKYQQIFDDVNKSKLISITVDDLDKARKLFVLQTMFGGLRGFKELHTAKLLKHKAGIYKVAFYQNKVTQTVHNPLNDYTERILKPLNYQIPKLDRVNARDKDKQAENVDLLETHYRALLRTMGIIIDFDRDVITDNKKFLSQPVKELFNPYFSRKTFGTILADELGLSDKQIELFTGHKGELTQLSSSYVNRNTIEAKAKLIANLKVGKNPYK